MRLMVVAAGTRLPDWVNAGFEEYAGRFTRDYKLELREIALGQRAASGSPSQAIAKEGEKMLAAIPQGAYVVAMQVGGRSLSSEQLAQFLQTRARDGRDVVFCIGGPEGLAPEVDARADFRWSLSALTLPHALARVVLAEALYRAVMIIKGHPYHRA
ncbi:23S rRNA (pseudouridine(1915)-N(3))-methyltransferase RlmH [Steroidobacter sp. S1-65]|uniref:Ribosomal RNA large subunit methyltransferase H n=1 Tax=Steroidobacter gossypii TaxID=2805490 RepID=A0ABS1X596_9GAMM|nr:23S rRNA (pseudouridine(1915)-N(3))-methyltransferase RlmH [Steroidobacter gossypii]MBM0108391.1 23S rRNA (pseudouridine(1915)-N(3))-methyltransferase RlmH [Steroidobacter gossypii]